MKTEQFFEHLSRLTATEIPLRPRQPSSFSFASKYTDQRKSAPVRPLFSHSCMTPCMILKIKVFLGYINRLFSISSAPPRMILKLNTSNYVYPLYHTHSKPVTPFILYFIQKTPGVYIGNLSASGIFALRLPHPSRFFAKGAGVGRILGGRSLPADRQASAKTTRLRRFVNFADRARTAKGCHSEGEVGPRNLLYQDFTAQQIPRCARNDNDGQWRPPDRVGTGSGRRYVTAKMQWPANFQGRG